MKNRVRNRRGNTKVREEGGEGVLWWSRYFPAASGEHGPDQLDVSSGDSPHWSRGREKEGVAERKPLYTDHTPLSPYAAQGSRG